MTVHHTRLWLIGLHHLHRTLHRSVHPTVHAIHVTVHPAASVLHYRLITLFGHGGLLSFCLAVLVQVHLQRFDIVFKTKSAHCPQKIVAIDCLPFLPLALVRGLPSNETDELGHAFLNRFFGILRDFRIRRKRFLHDPTYICDGEKPVLLLN
ncbi:hypothetical protein Mapa_000219 [Marchantia paleacea]|nr:hypothetical protein Mapa_000219 [Marchantia paleacea]